MKQINISGVIGWDATPDNLRKALKEANGDAVEIHISSPGGFVSDGIEMFNLIRNYGGYTTARLTGYAMSMASYIPLAAKKILAEDNAVYMIHNARGGVFGDHNDILKYGETTKAISGLLARAYAKRTGKRLDDVQKMMDAETYFFGQDMIDHGFIDEIIATSDEKDRDSSVALAYSSHMACVDKLNADTTAMKKDLTRAAAIFGASTATGHQPHNQGGTMMTLATLRAEHPDLVSALVAEATAGLISPADLQAQIDAAATAERTRIQAVEAQLIPGHEALIAALKFDGKTSGDQAAAAVLAAEKGARATALAALEGGANPAVGAVDPPAGSSAVDPNAPIEDRAKAEWDKDSDLRAEFGNKFESYLAYASKAETGRARIFGAKK